MILGKSWRDLGGLLGAFGGLLGGGNLSGSWCLGSWGGLGQSSHVIPIHRLQAMRGSNLGCEQGERAVVDRDRDTDIQGDLAPKGMSCYM